MHHAALTWQPQRGLHASKATVGLPRPVTPFVTAKPVVCRVLRVLSAEDAKDEAHATPLASKISACTELRPRSMQVGCRCGQKCASGLGNCPEQVQGLPRGLVDTNQTDVKNLVSPSDLDLQSVIRRSLFRVLQLDQRPCTDNQRWR
eukprot:1515769-Rhodomonas_salina.1